MAESKPKIKTFTLAALNPAGYNPRIIDDEALTALTASLERFGCVEPIIVNIRGGKNTIIGGHQRHKALLRGHGPNYRISCVTVDLSKKDEKLLNLTLNNPLTQGRFIENLSRHIDQLTKEATNQADFLNLRIDELRSQALISGSDLPMKEKILRPFRRTHVLLSFRPELLSQIEPHLTKILKIPGVEYEQSSN